MADLVNPEGRTLSADVVQFDGSVVLLHNRYRQAGGEERSVGQIEAVLKRAGVDVHRLEFDSAEMAASGRGKVVAAKAMVQGGLDPRILGDRIRPKRNVVVHAHNLMPAFGARTLEAARQAGAAVVLHLHNYRLFCSIGIAYRDGHDCDDCAPRRTWNAVLHNCRESSGESAAYAMAIARQQKRLIAAADVIVAPSHSLANELQGLLPTGKIEVLPNALADPPSEHAAPLDGGYGIYVGRLSEEKGVDLLIDASARAGLRLVIAGDGPDRESLETHASSLDVDVEFCGQLDRTALRGRLRGAAFAAFGSRWREVFPYAAVEAAAEGVPIVAPRKGGLVELTDEALLFEPGDPDSAAVVMRRLSDDADARRTAGAAALARAHREFHPDVFDARLLGIYELARARRSLAT